MFSLLHVKAHFSFVLKYFKDEMWGPCTFFLTLSPLEYEWEDMLKQLILKNGHIANVRRIKQGQLCVRDTATVTAWFHKRFMTFWNTCILGPKGVLGKVTHYVWRIEFQAR